MSYWKFVLWFLLCGLLCAQPAPEISYQSVPDFLKLPKDTYFGEVAGVPVNSKGHIFVFSRGGTGGPAYGGAAAQLVHGELPTCLNVVLFERSYGSRIQSG